MIKCPRCLQAIHRGAGVCPHCGFSIADLEGLCGGLPLRMNRLHDSGGLLTRSGRDRVMRAMRHFERKFPQLWWLIHTSRPPQGVDLREFGFWVLNRAEVADLAEGRPRDGALVLAIDADGKQASLGWGYLLDGHLGDDDSFLALSRAHAYWVEERFAEGILRMMEEMSHLLAIRSRRAERKGGRS